MTDLVFALCIQGRKGDRKSDALNLNSPYSHGAEGQAGRQDHWLVADGTALDPKR